MHSCVVDVDLIPLRKKGKDDHLTSNCSESFYTNTEISPARKRWKILANALIHNNYKRRKFQNFDGFNIISFGDVAMPTSGFGQDWRLCLINLKYETYCINVQNIDRVWTPTDLIGFNNTGNIYIWPSEETLAVYVLEHLCQFQNSWVLELGGGMTCLAGLLVAKYGFPFLVHLTDGNPLSVESVSKSITMNEHFCRIKSSVIKWESKCKCEIELGKYDFILSADCLFFVDSHKPLLETIAFYLAKTGTAFIMAPSRNRTMDEFVATALTFNFSATVIKNYSNFVWQRHLNLVNSHCYKEDIHYPLLIVLRWSSADYWKSHDRVYCNFCKCWYTDNKASKEFHENGRRHKLNVQKKISEVSKTAQQTKKNEKSMSDMIQKMNDAAMVAYMKDLSGSPSGSSTLDTSVTERSSVEVKTHKKVDPLAIALPEDEMIRQAKIAKAIQAKAESLWCEAKTEEGYTYYWNIKTNESVWTAPKEGFMTILEYKEIMKQAEVKSTNQQQQKLDDIVKNSAEIAAALKREQFKQIRKIMNDKKKEENRSLKIDSNDPIEEKFGWENPETAARPLGKWQAVDPTPSSYIDLELPERPEVEHFNFVVPNFDPEPKPKIFKEKIITKQLENEGSSSFKKRKTVRGNLRQKLDDE